jgi:glycine oxidase
LQPEPGAGLWPIGFDVALPICPVKGQMIRMRGRPDLFSRVLFMPIGGCSSILQRSPGEYIAGTSEEYLDPTAGNTVAVSASILSRVAALLHEGAGLELDALWSGFRPMTPDELPVLDRVRDGRLFIATGHHRNGVLLSAITGRLIAEMLREVPPSAELSTFRYDRSVRKHGRFALKY